MAANSCNPCKDNVFKKLSSDPNLIELIGASVKDHFIQGDGMNIVVNRIEDDDSITDTISYVPYVPLEIQSFSDDIGLQIKGATVAAFNLSWTYNKPVETQSLDQGLTAPLVDVNETTYNLAVTGQNITVDTDITLTADDNTSDAIAAKTAVNSIKFGNFLYYGSVNIPDLGAYNPSDVDIKALTSSQLAVDAKGANPITYTNSGVNEYMIFAAPSSFTVNNFQDSVNPVPGGFTQVKTLNITNSEGYTEQYTVWRSTYDDLQGLDGSGNPITFSII